jgi:hypothetical protein
MPSEPDKISAIEARGTGWTPSPEHGRSPKARKARHHLGTLVVLLILIATPSWLIWRGYRQERQNHALIAAIKHNDTQVVVRLLDQGADANTRDQGDGKINVWQTLKSLFAGRRKDASRIEPGIPALMVGIMPVIVADRTFFSTQEVHVENLTIVRALLDHGADPMAMAQTEKKGYAISFDPLTCAAFGQYPLTLCLLLEHGANPNRGECAGEAVCLSALTGDVAMLQCLFTHGAPINDHRHVCALETAVSYRQTEEVRFLLSRGADVNIHKDGGRDFLDTARVNGDWKMIRLLKQYGARAGRPKRVR